MTSKQHRVGNYIVYGGTIGHGSFAKVYYGFHSQSKLEVAVKYINEEKMQLLSLERLQRGMRVMQAAQHPNVVALYEWQYYENSRKAYVFLEYCNSGSLAELVKREKYLVEDEIRHYLRQIRDALQHLHKHHIRHRDLKLSNFLLHTPDAAHADARGVTTFKDTVVKLSDFDFAKILDDPAPNGANAAMTATICGSPLYWSPETFQNQGQLGSNSELWSLGLMIYEMTFGCLPFKGLKSWKELPKILEGGIQIERNSNVSEDLMNLISGLLQTESTQRMTWEQFFDHSYFAALAREPSLPAEVTQVAEFKTPLNIIDDYCTSAALNTKSQPILISRTPSFNFSEPIVQNSTTFTSSLGTSPANAFDILSGGSFTAASASLYRLLNDSIALWRRNLAATATAVAKQ